MKYHFTLLGNSCCFLKFVKYFSRGNNGKCFYEEHEEGQRWQRSPTSLSHQLTSAFLWIDI
jgi:hypothetical protein